MDENGSDREQRERLTDNTDEAAANVILVELVEAGARHLLHRELACGCQLLGFVWDDCFSHDLNPAFDNGSGVNEELHR